MVTDFWVDEWWSFHFIHELELEQRLDNVLKAMDNGDIGHAYVQLRQIKDRVEGNKYIPRNECVKD